MFSGAYDLADLGFFLLFLCCLTSIYSVFSAVAAAFMRHRRLYQSSRYAATAVGVMCLAASIILWVLFFERDYSVEYIFKNSSNDLPQIYTLTAFWSSLEGSHLLWTLMLAIFAVVALWTYDKNNEHIMPFVVASLMAVLGWMFYLLISHSDPFIRMFPVAANGRGMNELLQNPYMAIHPPTLFFGYTALAIPFAYSVAALGYGDITEGWLKAVRRWTLLAWCFLTAGIVLGGRWAYVELGWAGYWAWDPVENSSFIPWLLATALLHSLIVQDKLGHLKRLTIVLAILAFYFCFFGTFLTRSGIVSSVHSFAESPIGPNYLYFLAAMFTITAGMFAFRAQSILPSDTDKVWGISKESALIITQFLLLTFAVIVVVGTLYPVVSEAIVGEKTSVQATYFNVFAPWIGLGLIIAIAIGNLMRYQTAKIPNAKNIIGISVIAAVPLTALFVHFGDILATKNSFNFGAQLTGAFLCFWSAGCLSVDLYYRLRDLRFNWRLFFSKNLAYFGGYVAHIGLIVSIIGFIGNYRGLTHYATLKVGEKTSLYGYNFEFKGVEVANVDNATHFQGVLAIDRDGIAKGEMRPARSRFPTKDELFHEVAVKSSFWYDLYSTMSDFERSGDQATFEINVNPTVRIVWIAAVLMTIGGLLALFDKGRGNRSRDVVRGMAQASAT